MSASHPAGWTLIRIREATKKEAEQEARLRDLRYESGRSRRGRRGERTTLDDIIAEALRYMRTERERKNRSRRRRPAAVASESPLNAASDSREALYTNDLNPGIGPEI